MDHLTSLLGQDTLVAEIGQELRSPGRYCLLSGLSGSGKTRVMEAVAKGWSGDVQRLSGEKLPVSIPFFAVHRSLQGKRPPRAAREMDRNERLDFFRDIPVLGNTLAMWAKQLVAQRIAKDGPDILTSDELDLLAGFQKELTSESVLFVVDDVQYLDSATIDLIWKMTRPEVADAYQFIRASSFLFVEALDQDVSGHSQALKDLFGKVSRRFSTHYPNRQQFSEVLLCMGLEKLPSQDVCNKLYEITRGHLKLSDQIVKILKQEEISNDTMMALQEFKFKELTSSLLRWRLDKIPEGPELLEKLLIIAACLGRSFGRTELMCAFQEDETFATALTIARREDYLAAEGNSLRFTHDIIQSALDGWDAGKGAEYHDRLAECLKHIRPADYRSRFYHSKHANNVDRTAELAAVLLLKIDRGEEIGGQDKAALESHLGPLVPVVAALRAAREGMDKGDPTPSIIKLSKFYSNIPTLLQAEIAYQLALSSFKGRTDQAYEQARLILEPWIDREEEREIWLRLMLTLIAVYHNLKENDLCRSIRRRIINYTDKAGAQDRNAHAKLQVLNRKADMFWPIEMAASYIEQAVDFFAPPKGAIWPANGFQYSAALVNLSGNAYVRGEYSASAHAAERAIHCIRLAGQVSRTVEPYKAFNNYAISAYRTGSLSAKEAGAILAEFPAMPDFDGALVATNAAVLAILSGDVDTGDRVLEDLLHLLKKRRADSYYIVYAASNLASSKFLLGQTDQANSLLDFVDSHLPQTVSDELRPNYEDRQTAMRRAFDKLVKPSAKQLDDYPQSASPSVPHVAWKSIGHGFIMSDIQVWSES